MTDSNLAHNIEVSEPQKSVEKCQVQILDRSYCITCKIGESEKLLNAAQTINDKIQELRLKTRGFNNEQLAVLAALDLCHDLNNEKLKYQKFSDKVELRMKELMELIKKSKS